MNRDKGEENRLVLPYPEPDDPIPDHDEDQKYEDMKQREDDDARLEKMVADSLKELLPNLIDYYRKPK